MVIRGKSFHSFIDYQERWSKVSNLLIALLASSTVTASIMGMSIKSLSERRKCTVLAFYLYKVEFHGRSLILKNNVKSLLYKNNFLKFKISSTLICNIKIEFLVILNVLASAIQGGNQSTETLSFHYQFSGNTICNPPSTIAMIN